MSNLIAPPRAQLFAYPHRQITASTGGDKKAVPFAMTASGTAPLSLRLFFPLSSEKALLVLFQKSLQLLFLAA